MNRGCSCNHFEASPGYGGQVAASSTSSEKSLKFASHSFVFSRAGNFLVGLAIVTLFGASIGVRFVTLHAYWD